MMIRRIASRVTMALSLLAVAPPVFAQTLHTNNRWDECSIVLDPSLSQASWRQFVSELGIVTYFRPLTSARPLGAKHFEIAVLDWGSRIDDADAAWNDTFSHPDSTHWLFDGSALHIPGLMARAGITDRIDVGVYFTQNVNANYGFIGGQLQYNFLNDAERRVAASGRISAVTLFGPEDMEASTLGLDFVASTQIAIFEPYVGVSGYMAHARETTTKVDLPDETAVGVQATLGLAVNVSVLRLGAEYNVAKVPGISLKVAFGL